MEETRSRFGVLFFATRLCCNMHCVSDFLLYLLNGSSPSHATGQRVDR